MNNKRNIIITAIVALVVFSVILLLFNMSSNNSSEDKSVIVTLPDAQVETLPKAKIKAYGEMDKKESYDKFLSETAKSQTDKDSLIYEAMQRHTQATERLSKRMQSGTNEKDDETKVNASTTTHRSNSYTPANKDNWKERYDYLYDKLYKETTGQQKEKFSIEQVIPENIHPKEQSSIPKDNGFITITVGTNYSEAAGQLKVATTSEQKIKSGDKVQLRLLTDSYLQDIKINRNTYIYAIAKIENNRLQLTVSSINQPTGAISCNLVAYDTDGYKGLAFTSDDTSQELNREIKNALQTTVGQLAAVTSRTAGNIIRSTSRIGSNAVGNKQQSITLPANYMIQLR